MDPKPKRKYTASEKVRAANRRNVERANAVPKGIRYRPTPRRQQAWRENLKKATPRRFLLAALRNPEFRIRNSFES
jgi:hypothetical protein